ncbi:MAG: hypothetical protein V7746_23170 [Halioglobus sp.]
MSQKNVASGQCVQYAFDLIEEFVEAVQGWEFDLRQLSRSDSPYRIQQLSSNRMLYGRAYFGSRFISWADRFWGFALSPCEPGSLQTYAGVARPSAPAGRLYGGPAQGMSPSATAHCGTA